MRHSICLGLNVHFLKIQHPKLASITPLVQIDGSDKLLEESTIALTTSPYDDLVKIKGPPQDLAMNTLEL